MRVGIRVNGRGEPHPADRPPPDRRDHAGVLEPRDAPARGGPAVQSRVTQGVAEGRAILIAGAIGMMASLSLASPVMARSTARASAMAHLMARASAVAHSTARASMMAHLTARASARAHSTAGASAGTTCADRLLAGGSYGDVTVTPGHWCMVGFSSVRGNIDVTDASAFYLFTSSVAGNVTITGTTSNANMAILPGLAAIVPALGPADSICTSAIGGNLTITGSSPTAPWNVGGTNYPPFFTNSTCTLPISVRGNVTFDNNAGAPNEIGGSDIEGNLECHGNGNFTTGVLTPYHKNQVAGTSSGQCAAFAVKG